MKKITLLLVFLLSAFITSYGQIKVGNGNNTAQSLPFNANYGYSYSQSIYLSSEINVSGTITSLQWYYAGNGSLANSQELVVYLGLTTKSIFGNNSDFLPLSELTQVYAGGIVTNNTPGWKTITFATPFAYDNLFNLVIAVDENKSNYDGITDDFYNSSVGPNRSIYSISDTINTDPADPLNNSEGQPTRGRAAFVPNIILGGIQVPCPSAFDVTVTNVTNTEATVNWNAVDGQTEWEVYIVEAQDAAPTNITSGTLVSGTSSYVATGLAVSTNFKAYVRAKCSSPLFSEWSLATNFKTQCDPVGDFQEDFASTTIGQLPSCWSKINNSTVAGVNVSVASVASVSIPNAILMTNTNDISPELYLITPNLSSIGANTHRLKFMAKSGNNGYPLIIGTMSDPNDATTFTALQTLYLTNVYSTYSITLNNSTTDKHIAFKHGGGGVFRLFWIDDVVWEPIPTVGVECDLEMDATINVDCGNLPTIITWSSVEEADGYKISIGTSPNGQDLVLDNVNVNSNLSYSFSGLANTTYYYTVKPYNAFATATGCFEDTFTTYEDSCYCTSVPTSKNLAGITNLKLNNISVEVVDVAYFDYTEEAPINITQGVKSFFDITIATGLPYKTNIWIDYNDNYTFEESELIYSGLSPATNPFILDASFTPSSTAALGEHRMRIGSALAGQETPNPCYSGIYGATVDLIINVLPLPDCFPPSEGIASQITDNSAQLSWVSTSTLFNVEYGPTGFIQNAGVSVTGVSNPFTLTQLDPETGYSYYIQADCGNGSLSPWMGPYNFTTECAAVGNFSEDFSTDVTVSAPACWFTLVNSANPSANVKNSHTSDNIQMFISTDPTSKLYLITPKLTALPLNTNRMRFKAYSGSTGAQLVIGTMSDPTVESTFTAVQTIPMTGSFSNYYVSFTGSTLDMHVAFKFVGTGNASQSLYIDDINWETIPTCADVNVVTAKTATPYTEDISWTAGGSEIAWQYVYAEDSGTGIQADPTTLTPTTVNITPSATITGLQPNTIYQVWVRSVCGENVGLYSDSKTFKTSCLAVALPWNEGFEDLSPVGANYLPSCWSKENGDWSTANAVQRNTPRTGANYLRDAWAATDEYMWTPGFDLTAGTSYDFSFYMQGDGSTGWTVDVFHNMVQNSTDATQIGSTIIAPGTGTLGIQTYELVENTFVPATTGTYYFAVRVNQAVSGSWYVAFDDFKMDTTLSKDDFNSSNFSAYPNPVKDVLHLSYNSNMEQAEVFNLLGQRIFSVEMNATKADIDLSQLASGTYLVKISSNETFNTIKIIKE